MKRSMSCGLGSVVCIIIVLLTAWGRAGPNLLVVARQGEPAPATPADYGVINSGATFPFLDRLGRVVFAGELTGAGVTADNDRAIWSNLPGALVKVAREGDDAAGIGGGVRYDAFTSNPIINSAGDVLFRGHLVGTGVTLFNDTALWAGPALAPALVARTGEAAPGTATTFSSIGSAVFGNGGHVAFRASIDAPSNNDGIWHRSALGVTSLDAIVGGPAYGFAAGINFGGFFEGPLLNNAGHIAYRGTVVGPGIGGANDLCLWFGASGSEAVVAREGDPAVGIAGAFWIGLEDPVINDAGRIAFRGTVSGGGTTFANDVAIWSGFPGALAIVAREGSPAPDTDAGVVFSDLTPLASAGRPSLNDNGMLAFRAKLSGPGVTTVNDFAIYAGGPGALVLIAREGSQAPGCAFGATFSGFNSTGPALNGDDQVAFVASVTGPATLGRANGLWMTSVDGSLRLLAREGDILRLGNEQFRVISSLTQPIVGLGGQDGRGSSVNDLSSVLFRAGLSDGTGVILSGTAPPEWNVDSSGDWSNPANWRGGVPGAGIVDQASFRGAITLARTVTVNGDFALNGLHFNDDNSYAVASDGVPGHRLRLVGGADHPAITVSQGAHAVAAAVQVDASTDVAIANGSAIDLAGTLTLAAGAKMTKVGLFQGVLSSGTLGVTGTMDLGAGASIHIRHGTMSISLAGASALGPGISYTIDSGGTLNAAGLVDPFSGGGIASVNNNGVLNVLAGTKHMTSLSGTGTTGVAPGATLNVGSDGPVSQSNLNVNGLADAGSVSVGNLVSVGNGTVAAALHARHVRSAALFIQSLSTAAVKPDGTDAGTSRVGTLSIAGDTDAWTASLDLSDNDLVIDYLPGLSPLATVRNQIKSGYASGVWTGKGITSSAASGSVSPTALAYLDNTSAAFANFSGQTVDDTCVLVKYTFAGDANLDGQVDITDLGHLATHWQTTGDWIDGDSDYSGFVDITDLGLLATNWQAGVGAPLTPALGEALASLGLPGGIVPEPVGLLALVSAGAALVRRRGRRCLCHGCP